jgi:NO-binding membrane sensor protein with MHYT domain
MISYRSEYYDDDGFVRLLSRRALGIDLDVCGLCRAVAGRVTAAEGWTRPAWLIGGAVAMGCGIWSMHYIGMLAFKMPVHVGYDWRIVLLSLLAAIMASAVALYVVSRHEVRSVRFLLGGIIMGLGIAAMHYIGTAAMRLPADWRADVRLVTLSIGLDTVTPPMRLPRLFSTYIHRSSHVVPLLIFACRA